MFVGGFFTYSSLETLSEDNLTQSLALGGYGVIEGYHADGTLFYEWEGHNTVFTVAKNAMVSCMSGVDTTPLSFNCTQFISQMRLVCATGTCIDDVQAIQTLLPVGCDPDSSSSLCDSWKVSGTFNFASLSCTPGSDCLILTQVQTRNDNNAFNGIIVTDQEITPGDIIVVTITFTP